MLYKVLQFEIVVIADVCVNAVISTIGQIMPHEWATGVKEPDELASVLTAVLCDVQRKVTRISKSIHGEFVTYPNLELLQVAFAGCDLSSPTRGSYRRRSSIIGGSALTWNSPSHR